MPRPSLGAAFSITQLESILSERRTKLSKLLKARRKAQKELDSIERDIAKIGGSGRGGGGRARNAQSLPVVLEEVMRKAGKPMNVTAITEAVTATGYRSSSDNFRAIVNQTLIKERKRFSPTGERGIYQIAKKG